MPWLRLSIVALGIGATGPAPVRAAEGWKLPPLDGELAGDFSTALLPGAPPLRWSLALHAPRPRERAVAFGIEGAGTQVRGEALLNPAGDGTWRLAETQIDLTAWWPVFAPKYFPALADATVTGIIVLNGGGTVTAGRFAGRAEFEVRDASIADPAKAWSLAGLSLRGTLGKLPEIALDEPVRLLFREASVAGIVFRDGAIDFTFAADGVVRVASAECAVLDGRIALAPFAVGGGQKDVRTTLHFSAVELGGLGKFLPAALSDARGPVSGQIDLNWELGHGLKLANGALRPSAERPASITLRPAPGFLTERLPVRLRERFDLLPQWLGPMRLWFAPVNPAYAILRSIEMGESALDLTTLDLDLRPDGDPNGRTAHIVVMTRPAGKAKEVGSVRFELNVSGPLADALRLMTEKRVNIRVR